VNEAEQVGGVAVYSQFVFEFFLQICLPLH